MNDNHLGVIINYELQKLANNDFWINKNKAHLTIRATVLGIHEMWHWSMSYLKIIILIYLISDREVNFSTVQPTSVPAAYWQRPGNGSGPGLLWHGTLWEAQGDRPAINPNPCIALRILKNESITTLKIMVSNELSPLLHLEWNTDEYLF